MVKNTAEYIANCYDPFLNYIGILEKKHNEAVEFFFWNQVLSLFAQVLQIVVLEIFCSWNILCSVLFNFKIIAELLHSLTKK